MVRLIDSPPASDRPAPLSLVELESAVRAADPSAVLVPPRILRRVIKQDAGVGGIGLRVPHRKTYTISRQRLLAIVDRSELDLDPRTELAEEIMLIARPSSETLAELTPPEALQKYWRLLFHARVHLSFERSIALGRVGEAEVRQRILRIGQTEFEEIRSVLRQEDYLLPPKSDQTVYVEFAAVFLELRYFAPSFLRCYFPTLDDYQAIDDLLRQDVDVEALLAGTRPEGCTEPSWSGETPLGEPWADAPREAAPPNLAPLPAHKKSARAARRLLTEADRVSVLGNLVRAAILRTRAARSATADVAQLAREEAREELTRLARRLQAALGFSSSEADEWSKSLHSLLDQSARGFWTAEARMLYDLQKVCVDHERGVYSLDLWAWVRSLGRKPLKRFLPGQRDVLMYKHLRSAARRLPSAKLSNRARSRLVALLQSSTHRAETSLRARFKPPINRALDQVKLLPQNPPERVSRKKLVDEILDRIVERGFLSMSDLRDALSRNNLKLPDLTSVKQFLRGDQLLQADKHLAAGLDGVYHAGEIYLRLPQRLSSLAFGTPFGRFVTRYVALPFGGAYLLLEALQHLANLVIGLFSTGPEVQVILSHLSSVLILGLFLLGLMQHQRFRALCHEAARDAWRGVRCVFVEWPTWALQLPWVRQIVSSWQFRLFKQYIFKPLVISAVLAPLVSLVLNMKHTLASLGVLFVFINFVLNSRIGRNVDELVTDWVVNTWHRVRIHVFAAMFRFIMDLFHRILETIERLLYAVDEWLRFRVGESRWTTVWKAVLGSVWFFVNYFIRFCVVLLIEPQVNPIKHFPVVTVSHKILAPVLLPILSSTLEGPLSRPWALTIAGFATGLAPGMVGFLVWELKENWRLYAANRPPNLLPIPIGHHGETVLQLLKPGFRSGTVPKLYAKLRRASRKAYWTQNWKACGKQLDALDHVSEGVRRFVDRDLVELLHESRGWADRSIVAGEIRLGCNRILIELYCPELAEESLWLAFEDQSGWLVAGVHRRGWADMLIPTRKHALVSGLAGFYKMAGVDLVREQIENRLELDSRGYQITDTSLLVWTNHNREQVAYPLRDWPPPSTSQTPTHEDSRVQDRESWIFSATPVSWRRWVVTWELDQLGGASKHSVIDDLHLLPHEQDSSEIRPRRTPS